MNNNTSISVVLNAYKRVEILERQIQAILGQSNKPEHIYIWHNKACELPDLSKYDLTIVECSENLGVWARFAFALNLKTDYICLFDDDTIPGSDWFKNCLESKAIEEGLFGTRGLRFLSKKRYHPFESFGWDSPNEEIIEVDIVGHAWFFKREYLGMFWEQLPSITASPIAGEDIHFSAALQRHGIKTFVPPHKSSNTNQWGSTKEAALKYGTNDAAISSDSMALSRFDEAYRYYVSNGFVPYYFRDSKSSKKITTVGKGVRSNKLIQKIGNKLPVTKRIGRMALHWLEKRGFYF